jgi:hypothetical protein
MLYKKHFRDSIADDFTDRTNKEELSCCLIIF